MPPKTNLSTKCAKCGRSVADDPSLAFYKFPDPGNNDIPRAQVWAQFCFPRNNWSSVQSLKNLAMSHKVICSKHFDQSCYNYNMKNKELSKYAIPFDANELLEQIPSQVTQLSTDDVQNNTEEMQTLISNTTKWHNSGNRLNRRHSYNESENKESLVPNTNIQPSRTDDGPNDKQQLYYKEKDKAFVPVTSNLLNSDDKDDDGSHEQQSDVKAKEALSRCEPSNDDDDGTDGDDNLNLLQEDIEINIPAKTQFAWENCKSMPVLAGGGDGADVALKHFDFKCNQCRGDIVGFRYVCVQCADYDLCATCEARGSHASHYVLRVPGHRPHSEVQSVMARVKEELARHRRPAVNEMPSPCTVKTELEAEPDPLRKIVEADIDMYNNEETASVSQISTNIKTQITIDNTHTNPSFISNDQPINPHQLNFQTQSENNHFNKSTEKRQLRFIKNFYTESDGVLPNKKPKLELKKGYQSEMITAVPRWILSGVHKPNVDVRNIEQRIENTETTNPGLCYEVLQKLGPKTMPESIKCVIPPSPNSKTPNSSLESLEINKSTAAVLQKQIQNNVTPLSTKPAQMLPRLLPKPTQNEAILPKILPKPAQNFNESHKILSLKRIQNSTKQQNNETSVQNSNATYILPKTEQYFKSRVMLPIRIQENSEMMLQNCGSPRVIRIQGNQNIVQKNYSPYILPNTVLKSISPVKLLHVNIQNSEKTTQNSEKTVRNNNFFYTSSALQNPYTDALLPINKSEDTTPSSGFISMVNNSVKSFKPPNSVLLKTLILQNSKSPSLVPKPVQIFKYPT